MKKSIADNTKKRGRPRTTGAGKLIGVRLLPEPLAALDSWIAKQRETMSRPEAIRMLVEAAMSMAHTTAKTKNKGPSAAIKAAADRAEQRAKWPAS